MGQALETGVVIADRYRLDRLLGEGGMGSVWAATHIHTRNAVALKFLKPEAITHQPAVRRFMREARAATAVKHPHVIQIHDIFQLEDQSPVMVMDLLDGESLGEKLARERRIPLPELASIMLPVVSAVGTAHAAGIVHRDLKPDNIFLARAPNGAVIPKVLDFGIAKLNPRTPEATQSAELTRTGALLGTPYYMSPEQVFGEKDVDARSDVWAVGVILYEALAGLRPVDGDNLGQLLKVITLGQIRPLPEVAPNLPTDVSDLVSRMLKTDREQRVQSLHEAFEVLQRHTAQLAQSFSEVGAFPLELGESTERKLRERTGDPAAEAARSGSPQGVTADAFAHTEPGPISTKQHRPARAAAALALGLAVVVGGATLWMSGGSSSATAASEATSVVPATSEPEAAAPASAAATASAEDPSAGLDATASPDAGQGPQPTVTPGRSVLKARPEATPAKSQEPAPKPAAAPSREHSLGGVATAAPF